MPDPRPDIPARLDKSPSRNPLSPKNILPPQIAQLTLVKNLLKVVKSEGHGKGLKSLATDETNSRENKRSVPQHEIDFTGQDWRGVLEGYSRFTPKELERASVLMASFSQGARDAYDYYTNEKGLTNFPIPSIQLSDNPSDHVGFDLDSRKIVVGINHLERLSRNRLQIGRWQLPYTIRSIYDRKVITYRGTLPNLLYFGAVEEFDHAIYLSEHPESGNSLSLDSRSVPLYEYDSQPHEYRSLQTRLLLAGRKGLRMSARVFSKRLEAANSYMSSIRTK